MSESRPDLNEFLQCLGMVEEPLGVFYTDQEPDTPLTPKPLQLPTREQEVKGEINWGEVFGGFSCTMGHIWRARRKRSAAWFSAERFGCPGGAFYLGFNKPQTETIIQYVSSGIPGMMEGEHYIASPDELRAIFEYMDPRPAPAKYLVFKPLGLMEDNETPELVVFFTRPESMGGLHQLASFVTGEPEVVKSPFGAGCSSMVAWPFHYLDRGQDAAVLGGWDPSARKFYKTDELSFTVSNSMFERMLERWKSSFLMHKTWAGVQKKVERSRRAWGEFK